MTPEWPVNDSDEPLQRRMQVAGRTARVLDHGTGPPVVLIHGLGLSATVWEPHLVRLADAGYRGIAPDMPGFGESPGPASGLSVDGAAAWLLQLADALDIDRAAWIGHSVGTQQAIRLAVMAPDRAGALILAAPTGRTGRHTLRPLLGLLATAFQERPPVVAGVVRRYLGSPLTTVTTWARSLRHNTALDAPLVTCPTLLVMAGKDAIVPERFVRLLEELIPGVETRRVEDATHAVALEPMSAFMDAVIAFLDRYRSGDSTDRWNSSSITPKSHG